MLHRVLFAILCLISVNQLSAQSLTIKNGDLTKTFGADTYYSMIYSDAIGECCYTHVLGTVQRIYADSIKIRVNNLVVNNQSLDFRFVTEGDLAEKDLTMTFSNDELQEILAYKSQKEYKRKEKWNIFGGVIMLSGLITLANSYDIGDKQFREGVLISGGTQLVIGIVGLSLSKKKHYKAADGWRF